MSYSSDDDLDLIFHGIGTTPGYATGESDFEKERLLGTEWVDDQLRDRYEVPFTGTIPKMLVLAEANYVVGLILKAISTTAGFEFATYNPFFQEAKSNINKLRSFAIGPDGSREKDVLQSTRSGVEPVIAKSKLDRNGNRINPGLANRKLDFY